MASHDHAHHDHAQHDHAQHHGAPHAHDVSVSTAPGVSLFAMSAAQRLVGVALLLVPVWAALWAVIR